MNADSIISRANDISNGATTISSVLRSLNSIVSRSSHLHVIIVFPRTEYSHPL